MVVQASDSSDKYFFDESTLIRTIRKLYDLSQQEFCRLLGYTQSALSKIENGQISPDLKFIIKLSQHIPIDLNIFRFGHIPKLPYNLDQKSIYRLIQPQFINDGFMPIKSMYLLVKTIINTYNIDIADKLHISLDAFCLSFVRLNLEFINQVIKLVPRSKLLNILQSSQNHLLAKSWNKQAALSYLISHSMISVFKVDQTKERLQVTCSINKKISASIEEYEELLILFICYDMRITFQIEFDTDHLKSKNNNSKFQLVMYAN